MHKEGPATYSGHPRVQLASLHPPPQSHYVVLTIHMTRTWQESTSMADLRIPSLAQIGPRLLPSGDPTLDPTSRRRGLRLYSLYALDFFYLDVLPNVLES